VGRAADLPTVSLMLFPSFLLFFPQNTLLGQSARGRVLDATTQDPIQGALVLLLDSGQSVQGGFLTDGEGRFLIQAPGPGQYTIRAERIGYATASSPPFQLLAKETVEVPIFTVQAPVELGGLAVKGRRRCLVRPQEGQEVARVWEEARKALANQEWASRGGYLHFKVLRYRRKLDLSGDLVEVEMKRSASFMGRTPIRSLPPEDLSTLGYVRQRERGGYDYFGPDARVLLSDLFLATHCFRLVEDEDRPGMVGLAFEPVGRRPVPDIRGTFWLHRETATLALLEYSYTSAPWAEAQGVAGGRVEFGLLPSGAWVIRRWWIRMPVMVRDYALRRLGSDGLRVEAILEEGEEVVRVTVLGSGRIVETVASSSQDTGPS